MSDFKKSSELVSKNRQVEAASTSRVKHLKGLLIKCLGGEQSFVVSKTQIEELAANVDSENLAIVDDATEKMEQRRITARAYDLIANAADLSALYLLSELNPDNYLSLAAAIITSGVAQWASYKPMNRQQRKTKAALVLSIENIFRNNPSLQLQPEVEAIKVELQESVAALSNAERYVIHDLLKTISWVIANCAVVFLTNEDLLVGLVFSLVMVGLNVGNFLKKYPKKQREFDQSVAHASMIDQQSGGLTDNQAQGVIDKGEDVAKITDIVNLLGISTQLSPVLFSFLLNSPVLSGLYLKGLVARLTGTLGSNLGVVAQGKRAKENLEDFLQILRETINLSKESDRQFYLDLLAKRTAPEIKNMRTAANGVYFQDFDHCWQKADQEESLFFSPITGFLKLDQGVNILSGQSGSGKSSLALILAMQKVGTNGRFALHLDKRWHDPVTEEKDWGEIVKYQHFVSNSCPAKQSLLDSFYLSATNAEGLEQILNLCDDFFNVGEKDELRGVVTQLEGDEGLEEFLRSSASQRQEIIGSNTQLAKLNQLIREVLGKYLEKYALLGDGVDLDKAFSSYSLGEQKRYLLFNLLFKLKEETGILILDEPWANLDVETGSSDRESNAVQSFHFIKKIADQLEIPVLVIAHQAKFLEDQEIASRYVLNEDGLLLTDNLKKAGVESVDLLIDQLAFFKDKYGETKLKVYLPYLQAMVEQGFAEEVYQLIFNRNLTPEFLLDSAWKELLVACLDKRSEILSLTNTGHLELDRAIELSKVFAELKQAKDLHGYGFLAANYPDPTGYHTFTHRPYIDMIDQLIGGGYAQQIYELLFSDRLILKDLLEKKVWQRVFKSCIRYGARDGLESQKEEDSISEIVREIRGIRLKYGSEGLKNKKAELQKLAEKEPQEVLKLIVGNSESLVRVDLFWQPLINFCVTKGAALQVLTLFSCSYPQEKREDWKETLSLCLQNVFANKKISIDSFFKSFSVEELSAWQDVVVLAIKKGYLKLQSLLRDTTFSKENFNQLSYLAELVGDGFGVEYRIETLEQVLAIFKNKSLDELFPWRNILTDFCWSIKQKNAWNHHDKDRNIGDDNKEILDQIAEQFKGKSLKELRGWEEFIAIYSRLNWGDWVLDILKDASLEDLQTGIKILYLLPMDKNNINKINLTSLFLENYPSLKELRANEDLIGLCSVAHIIDIKELLRPYESELKEGEKLYKHLLQARN